MSARHIGSRPASLSGDFCSPLAWPAPISRPAAPSPKTRPFGLEGARLGGPRNGARARKKSLCHLLAPPNKAGPGQREPQVARLWPDERRGPNPALAIDPRAARPFQLAYNKSEPKQGWPDGRRPAAGGRRLAGCGARRPGPASGGAKAAKRADCWPQSVRLAGQANLDQITDRPWLGAGPRWAWRASAAHNGPVSGEGRRRRQIEAWPPSGRAKWPRAS